MPKQLKQSKRKDKDVSKKIPPYYINVETGVIGEAIYKEIMGDALDIPRNAPPGFDPDIPF